MTGRTHAIIGANAGALASAIVSGKPDLIAVAIGAFFALLPDLDASESQIKYMKIFYGPRKDQYIQPFIIPAELMSSIFRHRGPLHSLLGLLVLAILLVTIPEQKNYMYIGAAIFGYASHLIADMTTKTGIELLWPMRRRIGVPFHPKHRVTTGSAVDYGIFFCMTFLLVMFFCISIFSIKP